MHENLSLIFVGVRAIFWIGVIVTIIVHNLYIWMFLDQSFSDTFWCIFIDIAIVIFILIGKKKITFCDIQEL